MFDRYEFDVNINIAATSEVNSTETRLTLSVVALGPVVSSSRLSKHEVVGSEDLSEGSAPNAVHGAGLKVHQHGPGHVLSSGGLVVVDVDPLELEVRVSMVGTSGVNTVLIGDDLPELRRHSVSMTERYNWCVVLFKLPPTLLIEMQPQGCL